MADNAFEVLGRIGVDQAALDKELKVAEGKVRASALKMKGDWDKALGGPSSPFKRPPAPPGGGGGGVPPVPGGGGVGAAVAGMLPTIGIAAGITGAFAAKQIFDKYVEEAERATKQTLELRQAFKNLDASDLESELKKGSAALAEYNLNVDIINGKQDAGFFQKLMAYWSVATEAITGDVQRAIDKFEEYAVAAGKINRENLVPKAQAEYDAKSADLMARQAKVAQQNAVNTAELAAAYDKAADAIKKKTDAQVREIDAEEKRQTTPVRNRAKDVADKILADAQKKRKSELFGLEEDEKTSPGYKGSDAAIARRAAIEKDYADASVKAARAITAGEIELQGVIESNSKKRQALRDEEKQSLEENVDARKKAIGKIEADEEGFVQKQIARDQQRVAGTAAMAQAIMDAEESVQAARRKQAGVVESAASLEKRLSDQRVAATAPLITSIDAANKKYESQKRALEDLIAVGVDAIKNQAELADLEKSHAEEVADIRRKLTATVSQLEAKAFQERQERLRQEVEAEDKAGAHRVAMGRESMTDTASRLSAATTDPRRSLDQQRGAEEQLYKLRRSYADQYFKYYQQIGASTWEGQLETSKNFLSETVEGSKEWFDAVTDVANAYKSINDQAKSVFQQQVGIAEQAARAAGRRTMSINDVGSYVSQQREKDARALSGARVKVGDISGALSRRDLFKTMDREGLSPAQAFQKMMQDPQQQLRDTVAQVSTSFGKMSEVQKAAVDSLGAMSGAAAAATDALRGLAQAATRAAGGSAAPAAPSSNSGDALGVDPSLLASALGDPNVSIPVLDSQMGRQLELGARRGPASAEVVQ